MKAEIGQTDQIFRLGYNRYPVQSKEIIKFNLIFEVSHTLSNRLVNYSLIIVMVGDAGLEPATAPLSGVCSTI